MLSYEEFKEEIIKRIKEAILNFSEITEDEYEIIEEDIIKINQIKKSISIHSKKAIVMPTFYPEDMYKSYVEHLMSLNDFSEYFKKEFSKKPVVDKDLINKIITDKDILLSKVIIQLINTYNNQKQLKKIPHREFQDLSIVYRVVLHCGDDGIQSTLVSNKLIEHNNITEEELFEAGKKNYMDLFQPKAEPIYKIIIDMLKEQQEEIPEEIINMFKNDKKDKMFVISNRFDTFGAASMLFNNTLKSVSDYLDSNLYILPCDIHRVIAIPCSVSDNINNLATIVEEINTGEVPISEQLSNQVYFYNKDKGSIVVITNNDSLFKEKLKNDLIR